MTKRDFFILLIKVFGLLSLITVLFSVLPNNIALALQRVDLISMVWIGIVAIVVIGLFLLLIYRAEYVVRLLKLDSGFDDDRIELGNLKATDIIRISCFIIGGLLIINNIPVFLSYTFFAFIRFDTGDMQRFHWLVSGIKVLLGFLLLINFEAISRMLNSKKES